MNSARAGGIFIRSNNHIRAVVCFWLTATIVTGNYRFGAHLKFEWFATIHVRDGPTLITQDAEIYNPQLLMPGR
jgi:hypothetical protein